jgi:hypothetical protein
MKNFRNSTAFWIGTWLVTTWSLSAQAQFPEIPRDGNELPAASPNDPQGGIHPDLLRQMQEIQRYEARQDLAQQGAMEKAQQRRARLAAARWYGHSPLRPMVSSIPTMGTYFPVWSSDVTRPAQWFHIRASHLE